MVSSQKSSKLFLYFLILYFGDKVVGVTYGHHTHTHPASIESFINIPKPRASLVSLTKYDRSFRGPTIFSPDTGRTLFLRDYPNYSVVIPLVPDSPAATSNQVFLARRISGPGEFEVEAPKGYGVMAVIQSLDLRTAMTGCNDFIQFGEVDGVETTGICGKVDNRDGSFNPSGLVGPRVFLSPNGKMRMLFYHGYIWGLVRNFNFDILDPSRNPVLRVEVVFTAYKDCGLNHTNSKEFRPCSVYSSNSNTCINSQLFCDRIVNCAFEQDFGSDEDPSNCHRWPPTYRPVQVVKPIEITQQLPPPPTTQEIKTTSTSTTTATTSTTANSSTAEPLLPQTEPQNIEATDKTSQSLLGKVPEIPKNIVDNKISEDSKMPLTNDGELFVEAGSDNLVKYEAIEDTVSEPETPNGLVAGVVSLTAIIIILFVFLRVYYSYNKVKWNPNTNAPGSSRPPPVVIGHNDPSEIADAEEGKGKSSGSMKKEKTTEQPPPYHALFPIPTSKTKVEV